MVSVKPVFDVSLFINFIDYFISVLFSGSCKDGNFEVNCHFP